MSIDSTKYQPRASQFAKGSVSFSELEVVCLFSALGLVLTAIAMTLGGFDEMVRAMAGFAY